MSNLYQLIKVSIGSMPPGGSMMLIVMLRFVRVRAVFLVLQIWPWAVYIYIYICMYLYT